VELSGNTICYAESDFIFLLIIMIDETNQDEQKGQDTGNSVPAEETIQDQAQAVEETADTDNQEGVENVQEEKIKEEEKKEEDPNAISCYMPMKLNINYLGEWVLKLGPLCYGVSVR
jgi:hypothetical protein